MRNAVLFTLLIILFFSHESKSQNGDGKIQMEEIEAMFDNMKLHGVNTDQVLLWGYFFVSPKKSKFDQVRKVLDEREFKFVEIFQTESKNYWLHLERIEMHNPKSLFELDEYLYKVAHKFKVTYDGFDVGNVDPKKPLVNESSIISD